MNEKETRSLKTYYHRGGIDRTGFAVMILEMLMGAGEEEIAADYMESYVNLYCISRDSKIYQSLYESTIKRIRSIVEKYGNPTGTDSLQEAAKTYLFDIGMSEETLNRLIDKLSGNG